MLNIVERAPAVFGVPVLAPPLKEHEHILEVLVWVQGLVWGYMGSFRGTCVFGAGPLLRAVFVFVKDG